MTITRLFAPNAVSWLVPGYQKEDLVINLIGSVLHVSGKIQNAAVEKLFALGGRETEFGDEILIPFTKIIDQATLENGVLTISFLPRNSATTVVHIPID